MSKPSAFWRGFGLTMAYQGVHSLLASRGVKRAVAARIGPRRFNTFYRLAFNAFALPTFAWLLFDVKRNSGGLAFELHGWKKRAAQLVGALALGWALWGAWQVKLGRLSGFGPALKGLRGVDEPDAPEGQNPSFAQGAPRGGPFSHQRHPLNFAIPFIFWSWPRQSRASLGMNAAITLYSLVGSLLTDRRMRERYPAFEPYRERVPLLLPKLDGDDSA